MPAFVKNIFMFLKTCLQSCPLFRNLIIFFDIKIIFSDYILKSFKKS